MTISVGLEDWDDQISLALMHMSKIISSDRTTRYLYPVHTFKLWFTYSIISYFGEDIHDEDDKQKNYHKDSNVVMSYNIEF